MCVILWIKLLGCIGNPTVGAENSQPRSVVPDETGEKNRFGSGESKQCGGATKETAQSATCERRASDQGSPAAFCQPTLSRSRAKILQILELDPANVFTLANLAAIQLEQNRLEDAEATLKRALEIDADDSYSLSLSGILKFRQEKYDEALERLSRAATLDPRNPETQNYLGITLSQKGQTQAAEAALRKAVALAPRFGALITIWPSSMPRKRRRNWLRHASIIRKPWNLGIQGTRNWRRSCWAVQILRPSWRDLSVTTPRPSHPFSTRKECWTAPKRLFGPEHRETATRLNDLAELYSDSGDFAQAKTLHERALQIREKVLGQDDPYTAASLNSLALVHQSMGDYAKADPLIQRALRILEKTFGPEDPNTAATLNNLAGLYQKNRRLRQGRAALPARLENQ